MKKINFQEKELTFLTRESDPHVRAAAAAIAGVTASVVLALATLRAAGTEAILSAFCHKFKTLSTFASCVATSTVCKFTSIEDCKG